MSIITVFFCQVPVFRINSVAAVGVTVTPWLKMAVSSFGKCGMQYKKTCTESYTLFPECVLNCWCLNSLMYKLNLHFGETKFLFSSLDSANLLCLSYFPFKFDFANSHVEGTGCLIAKWKYYLNASLPLCHLTDSCLIPSSWKIKVFFFLATALFLFRFFVRHFMQYLFWPSHFFKMPLHWN